MHCSLSSLTSLRHTANNKLHQNSIYTKRESGDEVGEVKYALFLIFTQTLQTTNYIKIQSTQNERVVMKLEKSSMHCFLSSLRHTANNKLHQNSIYLKRESVDEVGKVKYALFLIFAHFTQTHCKQQTTSKFDLHKTREW